MTFEFSLYVMNESGALLVRFGNIFPVSNEHLKVEAYRPHTTQKNIKFVSRTKIPYFEGILKL